MFDCCSHNIDCYYLTQRCLRRSMYRFLVHQYIWKPMKSNELTDLLPICRTKLMEQSPLISENRVSEFSIKPSTSRIAFDEFYKVNLSDWRRKHFAQIQVLFWASSGTRSRSSAENASPSCTSRSQDAFQWLWYLLSTLVSFAAFGALRGAYYFVH